MAEFLEELMNLPSVYQARRSPDAQLVALNIANLHPNFDIFVTNPQDPTTITPLTNTNELTVFHQWFPDSKSVIISQDTARNERTTCYRVFLDEPNKLHPLTQVNPDFFLRTPCLSPDGGNLYFFANYDFDEKKETEISYLYLQNLDSGIIKKIASPAKPAYNVCFINKDGSNLLYNRSDIHPGGTQCWLVQSNGNNDHEILNFGDEAKIDASWSPDSTNIVFTTDSFEGKRLKTRLTGIYNISTKKIRWLNKPGESDPDLSSHDFSRGYFSRYETNILVLWETVKAKEQVSIFILDKNKLIRFPKLLGTILPIQNLKGSLWLGMYYSSTQPMTTVVFPIDDLEKLTQKNLKPIFDNFAKTTLSKSNMVTAEDIHWQSNDDFDIHGWLYRSPSQTKRAIIYVHGGPTAHSEEKFNAEIQYYLSQGFNVLDPNYRGSTGYGVEFREAIKANGWGSDEQTDIANGAKNLIKLNLAEKGHIGVTGTSYGGFSAWCSISKFPEIFGASAPVCGMTDLVVDYNTTRPDLRPLSAEMMGGTPEEVPERYEKGSPINYMQNITGDVLIVQGLRDPNVTPENVKVMREKLDSHNISYEMLEFEDEGHGIVRKINRKKKIESIAKFFDKTL